MISDDNKYQKIIDNRLKPPKSFFEFCYNSIPATKWSNKEQVIETEREGNCRVIERRLTKRSKLDFFDKFYSFGIVLVTAKRIEIQGYSFYSEYISGKQSIECRLSNFERFENDNHIKLSFQHGRYVPWLTANFMGGGPYTGTVFYDNGWGDKIQQVSELKYLEFPKGFSHYDIPKMYKYRNEIEFLQKIGAKRLASDIAYGTVEYSSGGVHVEVDMRVITKKWLQSNKVNLRNSDRSFKDYELERRIKARNGKLVPGIEEYLTFRDIKHIPKLAKINRFQNWIIKNKVNFKYYLDYLGLLKDLEIVPDTDNLIMPKDLTKAHDNLVELYNQRENEIKTQQFKKRMKSLAKYNQTVSGYAFIVPTDSAQLIQEGKALSHCVGSSRYIEEHTSGKTTIVFVRLASDVDKALYTMEFKNSRIAQLRGKHNRTAPEDVWEAAKKWQKLLTNKRKIVGG